MSKQLDHWTGEEGREYAARGENNLTAPRVHMWEHIINAVPELEGLSTLEVGCNKGYNLKILQTWGHDVVGIDPVGKIPERFNEGILINKGVAEDIKFGDDSFDFVFSCGVLIHIHPDNQLKAIREMVRVAKKYIAVIEYFDANLTSVPYRGKNDLLWKRDYGSLVMNEFPLLNCVAYGFFWKRLTGLDNLTYWVFEK